MAKPGPAPKPTAILKLRGSRWAKGREGKEPQAERGPPECPEWLDGEARTAWDKLVPILDTMKVLTVADGLALARYCVLFARWRVAVRFIAEHGQTYPIKIYSRTKSGKIVDEKIAGFHMFPQVKIAENSEDRMLRLEQQFGLTPSARARIATEANEREDDLDRYLQEGSRAG